MNDQPVQAQQFLTATETYPDNLGEGKLYNTPENDLLFLSGLALEHAGRWEDATEKFRAASRGSSEPVQAMYYNDPKLEKLFYQGFAWQCLGASEKNRHVINGAA